MFEGITHGQERMMVGEQTMGVPKACHAVRAHEPVVPVLFSSQSHQEGEHADAGPAPRAPLTKQPSQ